jgi:hypothetical protein
MMRVDELLDDVQERSGVAREEHVVLAGEFDVAGAVDVLGDVAGLPESQAGAADHQRRHPDRPQEMTHVNFEAGALAPIGELRRHRQA